MRRDHALEAVPKQIQFEIAVGWAWEWRRIEMPEADWAKTPERDLLQSESSACDRQLPGYVQILRLELEHLCGFEGSTCWIWRAGREQYNQLQAKPVSHDMDLAISAVTETDTMPTDHLLARAPASAAIVVFAAAEAGE